VIDSIKTIFRKITWCRFGNHLSAIALDDKGAAGSFVCSDCGHYEPSIKWPKAPPRPKAPISHVTLIGAAQ
jgi:hypothetical protein